MNSNNCFDFFNLSAYRVKFIYVLKCKILHKNISKTIVKTCENDFSSTKLVTKVKVDILQKSLFRHNIYLPSKVINCGLSEYHFFR